MLLRNVFLGLQALQMQKPRVHTWGGETVKKRLRQVSSSSAQELTEVFFIPLRRKKDVILLQPQRGAIVD